MPLGDFLPDPDAFQIVWSLCIRRHCQAGRLTDGKLHQHKNRGREKDDHRVRPTARMPWPLADPCAAFRHGNELHASCGADTQWPPQACFALLVPCNLMIAPGTITN
jgi:hypothetical protein